jgi:hypothetical protein
MAVKPIVGHGQKLSRPQGQTIGFVDTKEQFNAVTKALKAAGYAEPTISALKGEAGVDMLKRMQDMFYFGDGEDALMELSIKELGAGHYLLSVRANDQEDAVRVASLSEPHGAHSFSYFGTWVNERLTR